MTRQESILGNARIVLAERVIERGWVAIADGRIAEFGEGRAPAGSEDAAGDLVMPGLIELHTDQRCNQNKGQLRDDPMCQRLSKHNQNEWLRRQ